MAGFQALIAHVEGQQWLVSFSRFITFPSLPTSTCQSLIPLPSTGRGSFKSQGSWISSQSPTAVLRLHNHHFISHAILTVCFGGYIIEEHYVSQLHFTWPQVTCCSGLHPPTGSRSIIVSYKDSFCQIQKFALRFSVVTEAEAFVKALKDILNASTRSEALQSDIQSEFSLESMITPVNRNPYRAYEEESGVMTPVQICSPHTQFPAHLNHEVEQDGPTDWAAQPNRNPDGVSPALPPSFSSFLTQCCPNVQQVTAQPSSCEDLISQIARCMEDSSFQEMLSKVEKVISEIGDDLIL